MTAAQRALQRIREEMRTRDLTQRDLADRLQCSQSRIAKILKGGVNLRVDDLATLAQAVQLPLSETVRDRGFEFYAELTPSELRILEWLRQNPDTLKGLQHLMTAFVNSGVTRFSSGRGRVGRPLTNPPAKVR